MLPRNMVILWKERLSAVMFSDFFRKSYLNGMSVDPISVTLFDDAQVMSETLLPTLQGSQFHIIFAKETKVRNPENKVLKLLVESCDLVYSIDHVDPTNVETLKALPGCEEFSKGVIAKWVYDLGRMAGN
jgi:hypothetical protein